MKHLIAFVGLAAFTGALAIIVAERQSTFELHQRSTVLALAFPLIATLGAWAVEKARVWELTAGLALMVGGELGNVWFVPRGGVPDWIHVGGYLANVADLEIAAGAVVLAAAAPLVAAAARTARR